MDPLERTLGRRQIARVKQLARPSAVLLISLLSARGAWACPYCVEDNGARRLITLALLTAIPLAAFIGALLVALRSRVRRDHQGAP